MMRALFSSKSVYWLQSLGISCGLLGSFAPWRRPWLRVPPSPDMMSCVWRAEVMGLSRGPSSCRSLSLYVASLLLLGKTRCTSLRFKKHLRSCQTRDCLPSHNPVKNHTSSVRLVPALCTYFTLRKPA